MPPLDGVDASDTIDTDNEELTVLINTAFQKLFFNIKLYVLVYTNIFCTKCSQIADPIFGWFFGLNQYS